MVKNPQIYESFLLSIIEGYFLPLSLLDTPFQFLKVQNPRNMIPFLTVNSYGVADARHNSQASQYYAQCPNVICDLL